MKKDNKSHIVWVRLSESEYETLKPTDGRSIGNEIRHRIFGEERGRVLCGRPSLGRTKFITFRLSDEEFDAVVSAGSEDEPISAIVRNLITKRIKNPNAPYLKCDRSHIGWKYVRNKTVRVNFAPEEYESFMDIVGEKCESVASTARSLIFGEVIR